MNKAIITAEIGNTHIGDMRRAKKLIRLAKKSGATIVKFQKRDPNVCVREDLKNKPHPNPKFSYGKTYLEHRLAIELDIKAHASLKRYCEARGLVYSSSVFDLPSAEEIISLSPQIIKIPSCCNTNIELVRFVLSNFAGEVHISFGMTSFPERANIYKEISRDRDRIVAYHCTSEYPCPPGHSFLAQIIEMKKFYPVVGFSDHSTNTALDIAAYVLGAEYIERHFIDDKKFKHTDASASLEPKELLELKKNLGYVREANLPKPDTMTEEEGKQAKKLRYY